MLKLSLPTLIKERKLFHFIGRARVRVANLLSGLVSLIVLWNVEQLGTRTTAHQTIEHWTIGHQHTWAPVQLGTKTTGHQVNWAPRQLETKTIGHQDSWAPGQLGTRTIGHQDNWAPGQLGTKTIGHWTIGHQDN